MLSIVIITLNEEHYVGNLLADIKNQVGLSSRPFEILVIDGGSTDSTEEVVMSYRPQLPVTCLQSPKRGWAQQKNYGVTKAKGDSLLFLDADLRLGKHTITRMMQTHRIFPDSIIVPRVAADSSRYIFRIGALLVYWYFRILTFSGKQSASDQCMLLSKQVYRRLGGLDETLPHAGDLDFMLRAQQKNISVQWVKGCSVKASMRRFESTGIIRLILRYVRSELHRLHNKGRVVKDYVGYTQTNSSADKSPYS